jgi:DnaK suppressor protein
MPVAAGLEERLSAIEHAEQRLVDGTYGRSVLSGAVIPDDRLEADPAATESRPPIVSGGQGGPLP